MSQQIKNIKRVGKYRVDEAVILGKGSTGLVYAGYHVESNKKVAIKAINMKGISNEVTKYLLDGEKRALKLIKNEYVVRGMEVIEEADFCYLVMEEYTQGTLKEHLSKRGKYQPDEAIELFRKILSGYSAIIEGLFIHRDLKTTNIMLKNHKHPVIIDFGYCEMIMGKKPTIKYNVGSPSYMAPESYYKSRYSEKSDIWSLGAILYQMLTGHSLDQGQQIKSFFRSITNKKTININFNQFSPICQEVLRAALEIQPENRATVHKLKYIIDKSLIPKMKAQLQKAHPTTPSSAKDIKFVPKIFISHNNKNIRRETDRDGKVYTEWSEVKCKKLDDTKESNKEEKKIEKPSSVSTKTITKPNDKVTFMMGSRPPLPTSPKSQMRSRVIEEKKPMEQTMHLPQPYFRMVTKNPIPKNMEMRNTGSMLTIKRGEKKIHPPQTPTMKKIISDPIHRNLGCLKIF